MVKSDFPYPALGTFSFLNITLSYSLLEILFVTMESRIDVFVQMWPKLWYKSLGAINRFEKIISYFRIRLSRPISMKQLLGATGQVRVFSKSVLNLVGLKSFIHCPVRICFIGTVPVKQKDEFRNLRWLYIGFVRFYINHNC